MSSGEGLSAILLCRSWIPSSALACFSVRSSVSQALSTIFLSEYSPFSHHFENLFSTITIVMHNIINYTSDALGHNDTSEILYIIQ